MKKIKLFDDFVNEGIAIPMKSPEGLDLSKSIGKTDSGKDVYAKADHPKHKDFMLDLNSLQFYKLIDLLEADITAYGQDDLQYYEEITGIDTGTLLDLYAAYGYNAKKYTETKKMKDAYIKKTGKTWEQIQKEAEDME